MTSLQIGSLNLNGCRNKEKKSALIKFLAFKKAIVIFLQETHTDIYNQAEWLNEWKGQRFLSHGSSVSAGVAFLISESVQGRVSDMIEIIPGRMQRIDIILQNMSFSLINVYAPNIGYERVLFI